MKYYFLSVIAMLLAVPEINAENPSPSKRERQLNIMSFNIRMDTNADGDQKWTLRKDLACSVMRDNLVRPDIIGAQEVLHNQLLDILERLPEYGYVGVGRIDGKTKGEYAPIFYLKHRFEVVDSGHFWLSENPSAVGRKGWDAACERIATWVKLYDNYTKRKLFVLNTHFDHVGQTARIESAKLIKSRIAELTVGLPVVVTGDLNATPGSDVIREMLESSDGVQLMDASRMAPRVDGPTHTFHGFGRLPENKREWIDYVLVQGIDKVRGFSVIYETAFEHYLLYPSDHNPVIAVFEFKKANIFDRLKNTKSH